MTEKQLYIVKEGNIMYRPLFQRKNNGGCLVLPGETEASVTAKDSRRIVTGSQGCLAAKRPSRFPYKTAPHCK